MKKLSSLFIWLLIAVFLFGSQAQAQASLPTQAQNQVNAIWYNDDLASEEQLKLIYENETVYLPLRNVFEALDYHVNWNKQGHYVEASKYGNTYIMDLESAAVYFLNQAFTFLNEPKIIDGRIYASIEDIEDLLNVEIELNGDNSLHLTQDFSEGLFWKIEKDGAVVYLLGSIHVATQNMYPIRAEIEKAFYTADHLVLEVDITAEPDEEEAKQLQSLLMYTDGTTIKDHIAPETYERLQLLLQEFSLPTDTYDHYKPAVIISDLNSYLFSLENYDASLGIDLYYGLKALELNKNILELESRLLQVEILNSYSIGYHQKQLDQLTKQILGLAEPKADEQSVEELATIWTSGDDEGAAKIVESTKANEEMYDLMILKRHDLMLEKIEGYLNNKNKDTYFVIAGYLHMLGEDGLITLLKEKGYNVTRQ